MKLDERILDGKKPLDCFDAENKELIKPFLNKEGYVSNNLENFCLLDGCFIRLLSNVSKEVKNCFKTSINDGDGGDWKYFLPAEWVKEPKYRPFSLDEFLNQYHLGDEVIVRRKLNKNRSIHKLFTEYGGNDDTIHLGTYWFTFQYLYDNYEIYTSEEWKPFGVKESCDESR